MAITVLDYASITREEMELGLVIRSVKIVLYTSCLKPEI